MHRPRQQILDDAQLANDDRLCHLGQLLDGTVVLLIFTAMSAI